MILELRYRGIGLFKIVRVPIATGSRLFNVLHYTTDIV
jgi:hypothetical protein